MTRNFVESFGNELAPALRTPANAVDEQQHLARALVAVRHAFAVQCQHPDVRRAGCCHLCSQPVSLLPADVFTVAPHSVKVSCFAGLGTF